MQSNSHSYHIHKHTLTGYIVECMLVHVDNRMQNEDMHVSPCTCTIFVRGV
ncbi:hypothetical protein SLEP1_g24298 [Rubroshorea leprosula]|uniref:Uncharacterized protein n=1 Tax=Rubroshorea leprosula TaxID=152421 RepID=A0AAV5JL82_9ROSI|nr:hypothetical protein SLEP1_g24298 [Rubroshorea leprosula]